MEKYTTDIDIEKEEIEEEPEIKRLPKEHTKKPVKEKKSKGLFFLNVFLGLIILGIGLFLFAVFFCELKTIELEGVHISNPKEIEKALLSYEHCDNTVYAFGINLIKKHEPVPFVKETRVRLKDKNTLVIIVKEDETRGLIQAKEGFCYFDSDGIISEINSRFIENTPIISGITLNEPKEHEALGITGTQRTIILDSLKYLSEAKIDISEIKFEKGGNFGYKWKEIYIDMGISSDVREKCARLPVILPNIGGQKGILHLEEWGRENSDIIFEKTKQ